MPGPILVPALALFAAVVKDGSARSFDPKSFGDALRDAATRILAIDPYVADEVKSLSYDPDTRPWVSGPCLIFALAVRDWSKRRLRLVGIASDLEIAEAVETRGEDGGYAHVYLEKEGWYFDAEGVRDEAEALSDFAYKEEWGTATLEPFELGGKGTRYKIATIARGRDLERVVAKRLKEILGPPERWGI